MQRFPLIDKNFEASKNSTYIEEPELSPRSFNCLKRAGINTVEELQALSDDELKNIRNLGRKAGDEVRQKLAEFPDLPLPIFEKARGKVLFIDEAYSLVDDRAGLFGDEAINTLIQEMENNRDKTIVIFAGYPDEMESFLSRNPGLSSRVPFIINFSDYSVEEMVKIAELEAKNKGFRIGTEAYEKVAAICSEAAHRSDMGNGRFCRNLIESAILGYALRIYGNEDSIKGKNCILESEDFMLLETLLDT